MGFLEVFLLALRSVYKGPSGRRGSNPNPDWHDPGIPPEWENGKYDGGESRRRIDEEHRPKRELAGTHVDDFIRNRGKGELGRIETPTVLPTANISAGPNRPTISGLKSSGFNPRNRR